MCCLGQCSLTCLLSGSMMEKKDSVCVQIAAEKRRYFVRGVGVCREHQILVAPAFSNEKDEKRRENERINRKWLDCCSCCCSMTG